MARNEFDVSISHRVRSKKKNNKKSDSAKYIKIKFHIIQLLLFRHKRKKYIKTTCAKEKKN